MILCLAIFGVLLGLAIWKTIEEREGLYIVAAILIGGFSTFMIGFVICMTAPLFPVSEIQHQLIVYEDDLLFKNTEDDAMSVSGTNFKKTVYSSEVEKPYVLEIRKESKKTWYRVENDGVDYMLYLPKAGD
jgi:hypothetical protein